MLDPTTERKCLAILLAHMLEKDEYLQATSIMRQLNVGICQLSFSWKLQDELLQRQEKLSVKTNEARQLFLERPGCATRFKLLKKGGGRQDVTRKQYIKLHLLHRENSIYDDPDIVSLAIEHALSAECHEVIRSKLEDWAIGDIRRGANLREVWRLV